jgi:hypothetical protein
MIRTAEGHVGAFQLNSVVRWNGNDKHAHSQICAGIVR